MRAHTHIVHVLEDFVLYRETSIPTSYTRLCMQCKPHFIADCFCLNDKSIMPFPTLALEGA